MADEARVRKVQERILQTVASMIGRQVKDPRLELVTITDVRVTGDLQHASVFYTVLGGDEQEVLARLDELDLVPANRNAVGQIVAAGDVAAIDELIANPPEKARTRKLAVAGAFHTRFMAPARDAVAKAAESITPGDPTRTLLSNSDGQPVTTGAEALRKLVEQVTSPVRWDLCSAYLREAGTDSIVELTPAGTLVGIAKRELKGVPSVALKVPADLDKI